jgi:hypothetical protein
VNTLDPCGVGLFIPDLKYSEKNRSFEQGTPEMFISGQFAPSLFFNDNGFKEIKFCLQAFPPKKIARQAENPINSQLACLIFCSLFPAPASDSGIGQGDESDQRDQNSNWDNRPKTSGNHERNYYNSVRIKSNHSSAQEASPF